MLNFATGLEPLPSRMILWSDTYLEHEKANHHDIVRNHPFNYRMEIVLNNSAKENLVKYSEQVGPVPVVDNPKTVDIQQILDICTKFKENSSLYLCSNVQPINIIDFIQEEILNKNDDHLVYCHTLGANTDSMSTNQMAIYPLMNNSGNVSERNHHLRFRFDKDTLLEIGLQRNEKNKANTKKTSANSAQFESDNYSTVSYNLPFKNNSKQYQRLKWSLNEEKTYPIHCYFGVYSIQHNCWVSIDNFESYISSRDTSLNTRIKKVSGKEFLNVRVLKEENLLLPQVEISLSDTVSNNTKTTFTTPTQNQKYHVMDEDSDDEHSNDEEDDFVNEEFFTKIQSAEEEKEILKQQTAKTLLNCIGLLSGGMANDFLGHPIKEQSANDSPEEIIYQKNSLLFSNSLAESVGFSRVDQTFVIKLEGILPPLFIDKIFYSIWKNMSVHNNCYNMMLVTGMEDSVVSWKKFNHTYSMSGENDYLYILFPPASYNNQIITPNWLLQILNQQDEFS